MAAPSLPQGGLPPPPWRTAVLHLSPSRYPIFLDRTSHSVTWFSSLLQPQCLEHSRCLISMYVSPKSTSLLFRLQSHTVNFLLDVCRVFRELPHLNRSKTVSLLPKPATQLPKPFSVGPLETWHVCQMPHLQWLRAPKSHQVSLNSPSLLGLTTAGFAGPLLFLTNRSPSPSPAWSCYCSHTL